MTLASESKHVLPTIGENCLEFYLVRISFVLARRKKFFLQKYSQFFFLSLSSRFHFSSAFNLSNGFEQKRFVAKKQQPLLHFRRIFIDLNMWPVL
jgi:hypothetical protein